MTIKLIWSTNIKYDLDSNTTCNYINCSKKNIYYLFFAHGLNAKKDIVFFYQYWKFCVLAFHGLSVSTNIPIKQSTMSIKL